MKTTMLVESSILYFIFSSYSLCYSDVYRCESGRCCPRPFFLTFLSFHFSGVSFYINTFLGFHSSDLLILQHLEHTYTNQFVTQYITYWIYGEGFQGCCPHCQSPWKRFPYIQVSDVLRYKPIPIIYRTSLLQNSLKLLDVLSSCWNFDYKKQMSWVNWVHFLEMVGKTVMSTDYSEFCNSLFAF